MPTYETLKINALPLHVIHALAGRFDPSMLKGRDIVAREEIALMQPVMLEDRTRNTPQKGWIAPSEDVMMPRDTQHVYYGAIKTSGMKLRRGDGGKLVTTPEGRVIGIVVAKVTYENKHVYVFLVPAHAFVDPPAQHIREALKGVFNDAVLKDRVIAGPRNLSDKHVYVEGRPGQVAQFNRKYMYDDFEIRDGKYTRALVIPYARDFATKKDVGKLLVRDHDIRKTVVGVIADVDYDRKFKTQKAIIAPAWTIKAP